MEARNEVDLLIKMSIAKALLLLMREKSFSEIKITEIVLKAGVARASFYRKFKNKEEVVLYFLRQILIDYKSKFRADVDHISRYENIYKTFTYILDYKSELEAIIKSGFSQALLDEMNKYIIDACTPSIKTKEERMPFYVYVGSLFNVVYIWVINGCKESVKEISGMFYESFTGNINKQIF